MLTETIAASMVLRARIHLVGRHCAGSPTTVVNIAGGGWIRERVAVTMATVVDVLFSSRLTMTHADKIMNMAAE